MTSLWVDPVRGPPAEVRAPDAVAWLAAEHAWTRDLLGLLLRMATDGRKWERVISVLTEDLWIHLQIEDEIAYPMLHGNVRPSDEAMLMRAAVRSALADLEDAAAKRFGVLRAANRLRIVHELQAEHEEREVLTRARLLDIDTTELLVRRLRDRRSELRQAGVHAIVRSYR